MHVHFVVHVAFERIATEARLDRLFAKMSGLLPTSKGVDAETKRKVIQALVHQVVITKSGFKIHFYVGVDQVKKGERRLETACSPLKSYEKTRAEKISVPGSFKSLNGGPGGTRPLALLASASKLRGRAAG